MKVFRRTPPIDPAARARALARLTPRPSHHPHPPATDLHTTYADQTPPDQAAAEQTPAGMTAAPASRTTGGWTPTNRAPAERASAVHGSGGQPSDRNRRDEYPEERDEVRGGWTPEEPRPERLRDARWALTPRHIVVLAVVLVIGLTWAAWTFLRARPEPLPDTRPTTTTTGSAVSQPPGAQPSPASAQTQPAANPNQTPSANQSLGINQPPGTGTSPGQPPVVVHVAGKVRHPGLIRAPAGSRVADVLTLAGGPLRGVDLTSLNLARQVTDGEQIIVGATTQPPPTNQPPSTTGPSPSSAPTAPVNLNTATLDQLDALPGVGPVLAQRILDYRTQNGPFTTIDQLQEVPGVGPKKYDSLKPHVRT